MTARERLRSGTEAERFAACRELRDARQITPDDVRALVAALDDHGRGVEAVPDHGGGYQDDLVEIADVASAALRRHADAHGALIERLTAARSPR